MQRLSHRLARPANKFNRVERRIPGEYIVVLSEDTPSLSVSPIANGLAAAHAGQILNIYNALKGFSIRLPEPAAIALSQDSRVLYVEENGIGTVFDVPWDLDRIDQLGAVSGFNADYGTSTGTYNPPNDGTGVHVYVIDEGIRATHHQFIKSDLTTSRVVFETDTTGGNGNPCRDHGNLVASVVGGYSYFSGDVPYGTASFGVAIGVTLHNVRALLDPNNGCNGSDINVQQALAGIDWVAQHAALPAVANISFGCKTDSSCNAAVRRAVAAGVTVVAAAGETQTIGGENAVNIYPASEPQAITVTSMHKDEGMYAYANFGPSVDIFAPGSNVPGAGILGGGTPTDTSWRNAWGTSLSAPIVAGVAALYLHDHPSGTASLPSIVQQVIKSNANICAYEAGGGCVKVNNKNGGSVATPDRMLYTGFLPTPAKPIDNQRFFVWQQYADFQPGGKAEPDESGLEFWTRNITGNPALSTGCGLDRTVVNFNNSCTHDWRINTSLAFWVDKYPSIFTTSYGLTSGNNAQFVKLCYSIYLKFDYADQRDPNGFGYWKGVLDSYGDPASPTGVRVLIDQFLNSTGPGIYPGPPGCRTRFGAS